MTLKDGRKNIRAVILPQVTFLNLGQPIYGRHWVRVEQPIHHAAFKTMRAGFVTLLAATSPTNQTRAWALGAPFRAGQTANLGSEAATEFDSTMSESALESGGSAQGGQAGRRHCPGVRHGHPEGLAQRALAAAEDRADPAPGRRLRDHHHHLCQLARDGCGQGSAESRRPDRQVLTPVPAS
jgi:hypothetical protein